jgi:hypothetical protein
MAVMALKNRERSIRGRQWTAVAVVSGVLAGCGAGGMGSADAGPPDTACADPEAWNTGRLETAGLVLSAKVAGGALVMEASNIPPGCRPTLPNCFRVVDVSQPGRIADIDLTLTFADFQGASPGASAVFSLDLFPGGGFAAAAVRQADTPVLEVFLTGVPMASVAARDTSGKLHIGRHGGVVTVSASAGEVTVERTATIATGDQGVVTISLVNAGDARVTGQTSVRFTDFQASGSADIIPDSFSCDRMFQPSYVR